MVHCIVRVGVLAKITIGIHVMFAVARSLAYSIRHHVQHHSRVRVHAIHNSRCAKFVTECRILYTAGFFETASRVVTVYRLMLIQI